MSSIQVEEEGKKQSPINETEEEIMGLEKETEQMFEKWVCDIYYRGIPISDLHLFDEQCMDISSCKMSDIVIKHLQRICQIHGGLIEQSIAFIIQDEHNYYQSDEEELTIDILSLKEIIQQEQKILNQKKNHEKSYRKQLCLSIDEKKTEESYLWIIYQHFSAISKANRQISLLIDIMEQNNEAICIQCSATRQEYDLRRKQREQQTLKENQLNQITIRKLVPENCQIKFTDFRTIITNILDHNRQPMRKQNRGIDKFKKALEIGTIMEEQIDLNYIESRDLTMNIDLKTTMNGFLEDSDENLIDFVNINRIFSHQRSEEEIFQCYGDEGKQLNFHEYMSKNNFGSEKVEEEVGKKAKKKNKKKKKKSKKMEPEPELLKHRSEPPPQICRKTELQQEQVQQQLKVVKMLASLKISQVKRPYVHIPKGSIEEWRRKIKHQSDTKF